MAVAVVLVVVSSKISIATQTGVDAYEVEEEEITWFVGTISVDLVARIMISSLLGLFE